MHSVQGVAPQPEAVVLVSGGIDSTACLAFCLELGYRTRGAFILYGQSAEATEQRAAEDIAGHFNIEISVLRWSGRAKGPGMICGRNAFLLIAALLEMPTPATILSLGIHAGTDYPDCGPEFVRNMQDIADLYTGGCTQIAAPFLDWTKGEIWDYCMSRDVPLALTYSCENGVPGGCRACLSCRDREALDARAPK